MLISEVQVALYEPHKRELVYKDSAERTDETSVPRRFTHLQSTTWNVSLDFSLRQLLLHMLLLTTSMSYSTWEAMGNGSLVSTM
jgi:hypothetical protein